VILKGFDYTFKKGERVGIIGKNGTGKSTFLNILQGIEPADSGKVNIGDTVIFGNYAQQGLQVKEDSRVIEFVKNIAESFPLAGGGSLSASQFLNLFLFPPEQQYTYISKLSGGEKRRLHLLSVLFLNPNFLVLDEPTNDLDILTLNVLEEFLQDYPGCLVIASHDRQFMNKLVDHLFIFEGDGIVSDFPGNYNEYLFARAESRGTVATVPGRSEVASDTISINRDSIGSSPKKKTRLSYHEKREFSELEKEIEEMEKRKAQHTEEMNSGSLDFSKLQQRSQEYIEVVKKLEIKTNRWLELSELAS